MRLSSRVWRARRGGLGAHALSLVRPGAEAVLLAGVAIGCAQLVWRVAGGQGAAPAPDDGGSPLQSVTAAEARVTSPFAPFQQVAATEQASQPSELAAIRLAGVRMSSRPERSGAVLTMADGVQRSFLVGYEVAAGVKLQAVAADHVVLSYASGEQIVAFDRPAGREAPVFALATPPTTVAWSGGDAARAVSMSLSDPASGAASLLAGNARVELRNGVAYGWRVLAVPPALAQGGLNQGDLVLSVNGARPSDGAAALAAAARSPLHVVVERAGGQRVSLQFVDGRPT